MLDHLQDPNGTTTTRRRVVKTGAKIAYAAPLVAASMQLSRSSGLAVSGGVDFCGHSVGINGGCMPACTNGGRFTGAQCGSICGTGTSTGYCPVGQGNDNPCCNVGLCDPRNFVLDGGVVTYVGSTAGCPA